MRENDAGEIEQMRAAISCAVVVERAGYLLDKIQSTAKTLKYRRGEGEILIVNHDGRGWWNPSYSGTDRNGKGDVFSLVQHLSPGLSFGKVRQELRPLIGISPSGATIAKAGPPVKEVPQVPIAARWNAQPDVAPGSPAWGYLTVERCLPGFVIEAATRVRVLKHGPKASAWFAHLDHTGVVTGFGMRGPNWNSFSKGGEKTLFRLHGRRKEGVMRNRLVVTEAAIDAMSLAALECVTPGMLRPDSYYVAVGGGMGPHTIAALRRHLERLVPQGPGGMVIGTDADKSGERYAKFLGDLAGGLEIRSKRLLPPNRRNDWNEVLQNGETL